jgi:N-acetylmuramoyl-L-alanine amidase
MSALVGGHLRWYPVSKRVDLSAHDQTIRFTYDSSEAWIGGHRHRLERHTVKNEDGFWVPLSFFASNSFYKAVQTKLAWPPKETPKPKVARTAIKATTAKTAKDVPLTSVSALSPLSPVSPVSPVPMKAIRRIVIDPGHGGKDPGTIGARGTEEKAVNLKLAQELAEALREDGGYEVLMTRTDDTFIPLAQRSKLANDYKADVFVSIHCNASLSSKLKGFEVYFLSEHASDPHADATAKLENSSLALEGQKVPSPDAVSAVLRSLVKTAYINDSSELGALIDRHLGDRLSEPSLGVKQAGFYVLRGAEMPAILIETGFLSNSKEEKLLQKGSFHKKLVEGIAAGIAAYDERKQKEHR